MRIGLLTQEYHLGENRFGGVGRAFGKMAHWLSDHGHDVTVYMQARRAETIAEKTGLRLVTVTPKPWVHWRLRPLVARLPPFWGGMLWHWEVNAALTNRIMDDYHNERIEVLLTNRGVTAPGLMIRRRLPTVVRAQYGRVRTLQVDRVAVKSSDRYLQFMENRAMRHATRVYSPSAFTARYLRESVGVEAPVIPTPMFTLQPPAALEEVRMRHAIPSRYVLYWGSFLHCKGLHVLADALPTLFRMTSDLQVVLVGAKRQQDGDAGQLEAYIRGKAGSASERLHILPPLDQPEVFALIRGARVVALPSILDNLPNTLLEAMYFGALVVGTRGASIDELIEDRVNGLLVERDQPDQLAEALVTADRMPETERVRMGKLASERVRDVCAPDVVMNRVVDVCRDAVQRYTASPGKS